MDCMAGETGEAVADEAVDGVVGEAVDRVIGEAVDCVVGEAVDRVVGEAVDRVVGEAMDHVNAEGDAVDHVVGEAVDRVNAKGDAVDCVNAEGDAVDRVNAEGDAVDRVNAEGDAVDRVNAEGDAVDRVNAEGDAVDRVVGEGDAVDRVNAEGEAVDCVNAEGDAVDCVVGEGDAVDRVNAEGDAVDRVNAEGDAVDRVNAEGDAVDRVNAEGDAVDRVVGEGDAVDRVNAEGDAVDRVNAEGDAVDRVNTEGDAVDRVVGEGDAVDRVNAEGDAVEGENVQAMLSSLVYSLGLGELEEKEAISLWQNRTIIKPLDSAHISSYLAKRQQLFEEEEAHYQKMQERIRDIHSAAQAPDSTPLSPKGRSLRSGRTILSSFVSESTTSPDDSSSASEGMSLVDMWDDSSTDSGDVSDWTAEVTSVPLGRKRTRRQRRLALMSDEESDEDSKRGDEEEERASIQDDLSDKASPPQPKSKKKKKGRPSTGEVGPDLYALYNPPEWIKQTSPRLSPYLPQVGDIVVYCHQGHELYLAEVKEQNAYPCKNIKPPWQKYNLLPQEVCQVTNVRFCVGPPTLCSITLALLSPAVCPVKGGASSSRNEKITFSFKYHDMDGIQDFLILESVFKCSVQRSWEPGEDFQSLIEGSSWKGTVLRRSPYSEDLPQSYWQCYSVQWEDGVLDQLSPWDMHPLDSDLTNYVCQVMTTPTSLCEQEWGGVGEQERILTGLNTVLELDEAHMFREPVSLEDVPSYCTVVAFPTDLGTIRERLLSKYYRRKTALLWEVVQIWRNAVAFNLKDSLIVQHCRILLHMLWKFISSPEICDPMACYEAHPVGEVGREVVVTPPLAEFANSEPLSKSSTSPFGSPTVSTFTAAPWFPEAEKLLAALSDHPSSSPFLQPVDTDLYPNYLQLIRTPMDLSTILSRLNSGHYNVPEDFISDLNLIFKNAKSYNQRGSMVYKMATELQFFLESLAVDFFKAFPGSSVVYGTRSALGKISSSARVAASSLRSSCSSVSEIDYDSVVTQTNSTPLRTSRRLRAKHRRSQSSESDVGVNGDKTPTPSPQEKSLVIKNPTRTRSKGKTQSDKYGGYGLRTRNNSNRLVEADSEESEASEEEEEEVSVGSRKSDEEEAYLQDLDSEESHTSVLSPRKRPRRSTRQSPRKRVKLDLDSDYSGEEIVTTTRSRSGRVVKPALKYF